MKLKLSVALLGVLLLLPVFPNIVSAYYDPGVQRWITRDPLAELGFQSIPKDPTSAVNDEGNLFVFLKNSPVLWFDAFGLRVGDGKVHGNYCGGGYCGGKRLKQGEKCDYKANHIDAMDSCCKEHDKCYDNAGGDPCKIHKCDQRMCSCLKEDVDPSDFSSTGTQVTYNKLLTWACSIQGGGKQDEQK